MNTSAVADSRLSSSLSPVPVNLPSSPHVAPHNLPTGDGFSRGSSPLSSVPEYINDQNTMDIDANDDVVSMSNGDNEDDTDGYFSDISDTGASISEEHNIMDNENTSPDILGSRSNVDRTWKLQRMVNELKSLHWSFESFILAWIGTKKTTHQRINHRRYATQRQRRKVFQRVTKHVTRLGVLQPTPDAMISICTKELDNLVSTSHYGVFQPGPDIENMDYQAAISILPDIAPSWYHLLLCLMSNERANRKCYSSKKSYLKDGGQAKIISQKIYTITSIACHSRAKQTSNFLATTLDIYLMKTGTKRSVIETLSHMGLCHGYSTALSNFKKLKPSATVEQAQASRAGSLDDTRV